MTRIVKRKDTKIDLHGFEKRKAEIKAEPCF